MKKHANKLHAGWPVVMVFVGLLDLAILMAVLLHGKDIALLHPKGLIAQEELGIIEFATVVLLAIAIPALFFFYFFAWKYRETNAKATYDPGNHHGKYFIFTIWVIPCTVMVIMSVMMWSSTHKLDPHIPIASHTKPLTIEVIAMRWKWLFIYPEQQIAAVNYVMLPTDTPVQFELTADDAPMSSFWIPHLSGQLYAMTGMVNTLNIMADTQGDYEGSSAEINGAGFAGMKFVAHVDTLATFDQWALSTRQSYPDLDPATYTKLLTPSESNAVQYYANPPADLYDNVVMKYAHGMSGVSTQ